MVRSKLTFRWLRVVPWMSNQHILFILQILHLFNASFADFDGRDIVVLDKIVLHLANLLMIDCPLTKCNHWLVLSARWWSLHITLQESWLFKDVSKVDHAMERKHLVHMINTWAKFKILCQILDTMTWFLCAKYVVFIALSMLRAKFSFNDVWEWVRNLRFASEHTTYEGRSRYTNRIDRAEICLIKAWIYIGLHIDLQVKPDTF